MEGCIIWEIEVETSDYTFLQFEIIGGKIEPKDLARLQPPKLNTRKGVIISGRGPIWLFANIVHFYHPYPWVACYDPRLGGIVAMSHKTGWTPGMIVDVQF